MSIVSSLRWSDAVTLTPAQRQKERALSRAIWLDVSTWIFIAIAAFASGSLTILAELPRGGLLLTIEIIAMVTMRRSHRGRFSMFEYGIGKIERVISVAIACGLLLSAIFTGSATVHRFIDPPILATPGMILAVMGGSYNLMVNFFCVGDFARTNQTETSLILASQVRSRLVKTMASGIVVVVLVVATWLPDPTAAAYVDAIGALFVIAYMVVTAVSLLRESLPDLLDRALPEREQMLLLRVIARYFEDYDNVGTIRSRRSGGHAFIDATLEFQPDLPLHEATARCVAIERDIVELIPDAIVSITPRVGPS
jgi:cation diffusion facilitator family transporter